MYCLGLWSPQLAAFGVQNILCWLGLLVSLCALYLLQGRRPSSVTRWLLVGISIGWFLTDVFTNSSGGGPSPHVLSLINLAILSYILLPNTAAKYITVGAYILLVGRTLGTQEEHAPAYFSLGITLLLLHHLSGHGYGVQDMRQKADHLTQLATYDHLTGLLNRYATEEHLRVL